MLSRIPDWIFGFLFGIVATVVIGGMALGYLPSPNKIFGDAGTNCHQSTVDRQQKAESGHSGTETNGAVLQNGQSENLKGYAEQQKSNYDCLVAEYTGNVAAFTKWLVIVTLLLAFFGFWQVIVSRDTARRQLRAYVTILGGAVRLATVDGRPGFWFNVELKNSGLTPGYQFVTWHRVKICELDKPPEFVRFGPVTNNGVSIIGPGCSAHLNWYQAFSDDEHARIRDRTRAIFAWGRADYVDAFGEPRYFFFRCAINGPENSQGIWALAPYQTGYNAN